MLRVRIRIRPRSALGWLVVGLLVTSAGLVFGIVGPRLTGRDIARAECLQPLTAAAVREQPPGREVLVEGRLDDGLPAAFRSFVAYVREEYRGRSRTGNRNQQWVEDARVTPPLVVALPDGPVQIVNDDYRLGNTPTSWQEGTVLTWDSVTDEGTKRYRGLERGERVVVIGRVVSTAAGRAIEADVVAGGTRAGYIADARRATTIATWVGGILGLLGGLILLGSAWSLVRRR